MVLALTEATGPVAYLDRPAISGLGIGAAVVGILLVVRAQSDMGASWRIGIDQTERTELVTSGMFRWSRNPIFLGVIIFWAGFALVVPNIPALVSVLAVTLAIEVQVRAVEEPYLIRVHGDAYWRYASRTGRILPWFGRLRR